MNKPIEQTSPYELGFYDRLMFDEELALIDGMHRSTRRKAIKERGYPPPQYVGLRAAWLYSRVLRWLHAQPTGERSAASRKPLSEGVKALRRKHGQRVAEAGAGEAA
jgi:predicted DNA-binding transcriptional regulator AlpA